MSFSRGKDNFFLKKERKRDLGYGIINLKFKINFNKKRKKYAK